VFEATFQQAYPMAQRAVQVRSARAARNGWPSSDLEDLEQEGLARVWQALSKYDPSRAGLRTFIELVVSSRFASMLRSHRRRPTLESLDEQHLTVEGGFREVELRADVARALACVSPFDRAVAVSLVEHTVTETSCRMGVCRSVVYQAIGRLRTAFVAAGLRRDDAGLVAEYLEVRGVYKFTTRRS
jgi:RNA polymerase sigma factor (sigma-70 family)